MKGDDAARFTRVSLLWRHPLVAAEFHARLKDRPFTLLDARIRAESFPPDDAVFPAETSVAVVESEDGSAVPVLAWLESTRPSLRTVVLAEDFDNEVTSFRFLRAGVKGLVRYAEIPDRLPLALEAVASGGFWVPRALLSRFVEVAVERTPRRPPASPTALTPREGEILEDLLQNLSNKEIAQKRHLTSRTIKFHVSNVLAKYGVKRRADLLLLSLPRH